MRPARNVSKVAFRSQIWTMRRTAISLIGLQRSSELASIQGKRVSASVMDCQVSESAEPTGNLFTVTCLQFLYQLFDIRQSGSFTIWIRSRRLGSARKISNQGGSPTRPKHFSKEVPG